MTSHEPTNPRVVLSEDHRHIDGLLDRLLGGVRADDREVTAKVLSKLEKTLLNHINVEEMFVFPALSETHAPEAERLGREHAKIRQALGELGLALELHVLRAEVVDAFCTALREHFEREESFAYEQAERKLPVQIARAIADRVKAIVGAARPSRAKGRAARGSS